MVGEQRQEQESPLQQIPILYWLLLAAFIAGLYIFVLMRVDASRSRSLQFRFTSETQMMNLASKDAKFKKPSPFGKPVRGYRAAVQAPARKLTQKIS
jgi:hypothetical protein